MMERSPCVCTKHKLELQGFHHYFTMQNLCFTMGITITEIFFKEKWDRLILEPSFVIHGNATDKLGPVVLLEWM